VNVVRFPVEAPPELTEESDAAPPADDKREDEGPSDPNTPGQA